MPYAELSNQTIALAEWLPDACVQQIVMERAPLRRASIFEMVRVIVRGGTIILRRYAGTGRNPQIESQQLVYADFPA